jgi:hypothetical protein
MIGPQTNSSGLKKFLDVLTTPESSDAGMRYLLDAMIMRE